MVSVYEEKDVQCLLKHRVRSIILFSKVIHLVEEPESERVRQDNFGMKEYKTESRTSRCS